MLRILLLIPLYALQSNGLITGQIIDGLNQLPLSQANIIIIDSDLGTTSDEDGEFDLYLLEDGYYSILNGCLLQVLRHFQSQLICLPFVLLIIC